MTLHCPKTLLPWTVYLNDERLTVDGWLELVVVRSEALQSHLSDHQLEEAHVGMMKDVVDTVGETGMPA